MERARAERLLSGGRKLLKSNVEEQTAERLLQRLVGAGLVAEVRKAVAPTIRTSNLQAGSEPPRTAATAFHNPSVSFELQPKQAGLCPKCEERAVEAGTCQHCGIVVEKFIARQAAERAREQGLAAPRAETAFPQPTTVSLGRTGTATPPGVAAPAHPASHPAGPGVSAGTHTGEPYGTAGRRPYASPKAQPSGVFDVIKGVIGLLAILWIFWSAYTHIHTALAPKDRIVVDNDPAGQAAHPSQWTRPATTPKGTPWPTRPAYVPGYQRLNTGGYSEVTLNNGRGSADLFIKLYTRAGRRWIPSRVVFLPAYRSLTISNLSAATYDVRVQDLESGRIAKTPRFELEEIHSANGVQYTTYKVTLTPVRNGNLRMQAIPASDF
jgi:hypothetical protein